MKKIVDVSLDDLHREIITYRQQHSHLITDDLVAETKKWLGEEGQDVFQLYWDTYGDLSPVRTIDEKTGARLMFPHCVHLREGMQVRNFLRTTKHAKFWNDDHAYDNMWEVVIKRILGINNV